jgi:hypothetical protein
MPDDPPAVPPWMLAPHEEKKVLRLCQEQSNQKCAESFFKFGKCSEQHQLLFSIKCAEEKKQMIDCVAYWGSREVFEDVRNKFIADKTKKMKEDKS